PGVSAGPGAGRAGHALLRHPCAVACVDAAVLDPCGQADVPAERAHEPFRGVVLDVTVVSTSLTADGEDTVVEADRHVFLVHTGDLATYDAVLSAREAVGRRAPLLG